MLIIRKKDESDAMVETLEITKEEKDKLKGKIKKNWQTGNTVYVFTNEEDVIGCSDINSYQKRELIHILRRSGEVGAVLHLGTPRSYDPLFFTVSRYGH